MGKRHVARIVASYRTDPHIRAVLGPTNTGKTHLAIERMCAHASGTIGFPLRLLAREVYDKVCRIKGEAQCALITGEERIEPAGARYFLCTAEAMPRDGGGADGPRAFVALDEAQLSADRERGHIFTDRLLHARGRDETMLLGSATLAPLLKQLVPRAQIEERPRFSTLTHAGSAKLSRLPPRSAIVAFSVEQVYQVAELLRRFRGGAAVVMGALSPQTRNAQVELFQSGEVDYIVATDAIGMGLNLDVHHVAFAALTKFDGVRQRRLHAAEMAQIAGRAGRHQTDGSFGTLSGNRRGAPLELSEDEIYAIENHSFAPNTQLYWRNPEPRFDTVPTLIADLEEHPRQPGLTRAPEAIDLSVLKRLAEQDEAMGGLRGAGEVRRFWEACQLPDFRQQGADAHARFVARLWRDLREGHIGADFVAARIAELDSPRGDIDTLQGRLAAIRSWAYICQRPDWVLARDEMAARARGVEARLSDALHARLRERFVNRRTSVLMKGMGKDAGLLRVELEDNGDVSVEGERIGHLEGFRFVVDAEASSEERRLMLAAADKHMTALLAAKVDKLLTEELGALTMEGGAVLAGGQRVATLEKTRSPSRPRLVLVKDVRQLDPAQRDRLHTALEHWLERRLQPLAPLRAIEDAAADPSFGSEARALLLTLAERGGTTRREDAGLAHIPKDDRPSLRRLGIVIGSLDVFMPALLKPAPRALLQQLGIDTRPLYESMQPVATIPGPAPAGYRRAGAQVIRLDMAEKLFRAAHERRAKVQERGGGRSFVLDPSLATSMGLEADTVRKLYRDAGFRITPGSRLPDGAAGPPAPEHWTWRAPRKDFAPRQRTRPPRPSQAARGDTAKREGGGADGRRQKPGKGSGKPSGRSQPHGRRERAGDGGAAFAGLADLLKKD